MTAEEIIEQLEDLIKDRESLIEDNEGNDVFVKDKNALEEAVKVLTVIRDKRQVTFTVYPEGVFYDAKEPEGHMWCRGILMEPEEDRLHIKIQYEGEELTIKELVGKLEYLKGSQEYLKWVVVEREKEIALMKKQLADTQPVRHGRWIPEDEYYVDDTYICSVCGYEFIITDGDLESDELNYCPRCGAKMDGGKS